MKPPVSFGRNLAHGGAEVQRRAALLHGGRQRVEEGLKAADEGAEARGARMQPRPEPGHVHVAIMLLAELADQQRFPQRFVHALAHVLHAATRSAVTCSRACQLALNLSCSAGQPEADHIGEREMPQQKERHVGEHRIEGMELTVIVDGRDRARKQHLVARADLVDEAQHVFVGLEPVMVELLHRPVPVRFFETGGQPARVGRGFVDRDLMAESGQIVGGGQAGGAGSDDGDVHGVIHFRATATALVRSPQRSPSRIM